MTSLLTQHLNHDAFECCYNRYTKHVFESMKIVSLSLFIIFIGAKLMEGQGRVDNGTNIKGMNDQEREER